MIIWFLNEKEKEQEELEFWCFRDDFVKIPPIEKQKVNELIKNPPELCEELDYCKSRMVCDSACRCIRGLFDNAKQFNEYQELQKLYVKTRVAEIICSGIPISQFEEDSVESKKNTTQQDKDKNGCSMNETSYST